jgi:2-aminoadipate transaminase
LQYGATEGCKPLKQEIIKNLKAVENFDIAEEELLITSASQQALDMVGKLFVNPGDNILVTNPSYLGALQAFAVYGAKMDGIDSDDNGAIPASLEEKLAALKKQGKVCKFVYLVPDFQNPTGTTIPQERRVEILNILKKYGVILIEDSPYREIRFEGKAPDTFYKLDNGEGNVVGLYTFSKTFVPGLRLGYIVANKDLISRFVVLKQSMDLCTPAVNQLVAAEFMKEGLLAPHVKKIVEVYRKKRDAMLEALKKYMPEGVTWTRPEGGLFLWVEAPKNIDLDAMFPKAAAAGVAYVVGSAFYYDGSVKNAMRLNFSYATFDEIEKGVKRLGEVLKEEMKK